MTNSVLQLVITTVVLTLFAFPLRSALAQRTGERFGGDDRTLFLPLLYTTGNLPQAVDDFEGGTLAQWTTDGVLPTAVIDRLDLDGPNGDRSAPPLQGAFSALLGTPDFGVISEQGYAEIRRTIQLPDEAAALQLMYRIVTHDAIYSQEEDRFYDTFEIYLDSTAVTRPQRIARCLERPGVAAGAAGLIYCDGNRGEPSGDAPPVDLGEQMTTIDLSDRSGEQVTLIMRIYNRNDDFFNSWVYVDAIRLVEAQRKIVR